MTPDSFRRPDGRRRRREGRTPWTRIAGILDVPVATFFPDADQPEMAIIQAADLVTAFVAIENPAARRTCLAFVRAMASS